MSGADNEYVEYQERFVRLIGEIKPGQYGQYQGRLVRKLTAEQFADQIREYRSLGEKLVAAIEGGQTLNETLSAQVRAAEINLVLEKSEYFPW